MSSKGKRKRKALDVETKRQRDNEAKLIRERVLIYNIDHPSDQIQIRLTSPHALVSAMEKRGCPIRGLLHWNKSGPIKRAPLPEDHYLNATKRSFRSALRSKRREILKVEQPLPSEAILKEFYKSWEWKKLSYETRRDRGRRCECCGAVPGSGNEVRIVADHVKPIRRYWHLRLDPTNIQVLCDDCNRGKGSHDETDWRNSSRGIDALAEREHEDDVVMATLADIETKGSA